MTHPRCASAALLLFTALLPAHGGDTTDKAITSTESEAKAPAISWEVESAFSAVGGSDFKGLANTGSIEALDTTFSAIGSLQVRDGFLLRFGVELQRFDFSRPSQAPVPYSLESTAVVVGVDFQLGTEWLARIDFKPGL